MRVRIFLCLLLILSVLTLWGEAIVWEADFASQETEWQLDENWMNAGDYLVLNWSPAIIDYDLSAISPEIELPEDTNELTVSQWISEYMTNEGEYAEINILSDGNSTNIWSLELDGTDWGVMDGEELALDISAFSNTTIQIEFRSFGSSTFNFNYWYLYGMQIEAFLDHDVSAVSISGTSSMFVNEEGNWTVTGMNSGLFEENDVQVSLMNGDTEISTIAVEGPLAVGEEFNLDFTWTPTEDQVALLRGVITMPGDEYLSNNETEPFLVNIYPEDAIVALIWDNDNGSYVGATGTEEYLEQVLDEANIIYETSLSLPQDLSSYDAIFIALGVYCVG